MSMQTIPAISITKGIPTIAVPLSSVISVAGAKDLWEDLKRGKADKEENDRGSGIVSEGNRNKSTPQQWRDIRPGQIVEVKRGEFIPADILLLQSSDPLGICFVDTMNLDGETNLKQKAVNLPEGKKYEDMSQAFSLDFEPPGVDLYDFKGALVEGNTRTGVSINNLILRGSSLQQTEWVKGVAVYCGHESRIMMNSQSARFKQSELDTEMNRLILIIFVAELTCAVVGGLVYTFWEMCCADDHWYMMLDGSSARSPLFVFLAKSGTWILQLNNMVPISLLVTMNGVKFVQAKFITMDDTMTDKKRKKNAEVHTSQVLESCGQITHVFSDKTGTLTCNEMLYKACSVGGKSYGGDGVTAKVAKEDRSDPFVDFDAMQDLLRDVGSESTPAKKEVLKAFILVQAVCHTVQAKPGEASSSKPEYSASSPDELALISMAREFGVAFYKASEGSYHFEVRDRKLQQEFGFQESTKIDILDTCEFDNDRKRMSVVCKLPNDARKLLLVKGADSSVLAYINQKDEKETIQVHLDTFARKGLRTLCLGFRWMADGDYDDWHRRYQGALADVSAEKDKKVAALVREIEEAPGLLLAGATAIEDRLQDEVPETIQKVRDAGVCVWVLTGDKKETAISISYSCNLFSPDMDNLDVDGTKEQIREALLRTRVGSDPSLWAMTVTGATLALILGSDLEDLFYKVASKCRSVCCCRVSPKQKADVVELCKRLHFNISGELPVTLAIGDGANDVSMITAAHVGAGLSGKEGAAAARAADFAFSEFRYLQRLMFVHGRESIRRNATLVCYNFYKNMVLVVPVFIFGNFSSFSGQPFYEQMIYQLYNVAFTSLPAVFYAIFDRPMDLESMNEQHYSPGRKRRYFNEKVLCLWLGASFLQSAWLILVVCGTLADGTVSQDRTGGDLWTMGAAIFIWVIVGVNVTLFRRLHLLYYFTVIIIVGSVLAHPVFMLFARSIGLLDDLAGTFSLVYGKTSLRFCFATLLFTAGHMLIGEPLIVIAESADDQSGEVGVAKPDPSSNQKVADSTPLLLPR